MNFKIPIFLVLAILIENTSYSNHVTDSLFSVLDKTIVNRAMYQHAKLLRIKNLSDIIQQSSNVSYLTKDELYSKLFAEYSSYNYDSAFSYSTRLLKNAFLSKNVVLIDKSRIKVGFTLLSAGLFKETLDTLDNIAVNDLPDSIKVEYYSLLARTYSDMADFSVDKYYTPLYNVKAIRNTDSALALCDSNSINFIYISGLKFLRLGNMKIARHYYEKLLRHKNLDGHLYAISTSGLSFIYKFDHEPELAIQMLIRASIADIVASTKETVAIRNLAESVYQNGETNRAYTYVKLALEDAYFYGARHRKIQISDILPIIEDRQLENVKHQRNNFLIYALSISILSVVIIFFGIIIFVQLKKLRKTKKFLSQANESLSLINKQLNEANLIKEEYIANFFDIISEYLNRLEKMKVTIGRKITTRQVDDIRDIISVIDIKKEREDFYHNFDSIFLKIFPDFMKEFNSFLREDSFIHTSENLLTPEIRIYALIRLGFSDNNKIAKFLGYSLNTIYAYKTKINNKLKVTIEEFEKKLFSFNSL